jgi:hypothetical protein
MTLKPPAWEFAAQPETEARFQRMKLGLYGVLMGNTLIPEDQAWSVASELVRAARAALLDPPGATK